MSQKFMNSPGWSMSPEQWLEHIRGHWGGIEIRTSNINAFTEAIAADSDKASELIMRKFCPVPDKSLPCGLTGSLFPQRAPARDTTRNQANVTPLRVLTAPTTTYPLRRPAKEKTLPSDA